MKLSAQDKLQTVVQVHLLKYFPYRSEVTVFYLRIFIFCYFTLSLYYIYGGKCLTFYFAMFMFLTLVSSDFAKNGKKLNIKPKSEICQNHKIINK